MLHRNRSAALLAAALVLDALAPSCSCGAVCTTSSQPIPLPPIPLGALITSLNDPNNQANASKIGFAEEAFLVGSLSNWSSLAAGPPITGLELGLNDPCFAGTGGTAFPVSVAAFLDDLTDQQCRPDLGSLSDFLSSPGVSVPPAAMSCTPTAAACVHASASPGSGCPAGEAPAPSSCPSIIGQNIGQCGSATDAMGNPSGTFSASTTSARLSLKRSCASRIAHRPPRSPAASPT